MFKMFNQPKASAVVSSLVTVILIHVAVVSRLVTAILIHVAVVLSHVDFD